MEGSSSHAPNRTATCMGLYTRHLCAVCGALAIGRNFDSYTCLSCKAFFRRNAYNEQLRSTCRVLGSCEINIATRRHCSACRLNKCFQQGMKKELIRSLAAINQATTGMIMNRQQPLRSTTMDLIPSNNHSMLLIHDWNLITNIRNTYEKYCVEPFLASHETIPPIITTQPYRSRIKLQRLGDLRQKYFSVLASFIKHALQSDISIDDQYEYIKDNFKILLTINTSELMKSKVLNSIPWENDRLLFESILTDNLVLRFEEHLHTYITFLPYDPLVVKLFIIILALTPRIIPLYKKTEYSSQDFQPFPRQLLSTQNYYMTLLWKYVVYRLGYYDAILYSVRFIQHFLRRQVLEADLANVIQNRDDHGQLMSLFEAVEASN